MDAPRRVRSTEFRLTYAGLEEPVAVTVLGRVVGHYFPIQSAIDDRFVAGLRPGEPAVPAPPSGQELGASPGRPEALDAPPKSANRQTAQAARDRVLGAINTKRERE